ncbi:DrmB family protein [Paenibacillus residui]|uniref:DrmB family protein n=1 Tax=Paenibacillus residui TaxID=629724 RepID=A0ABW3DB40_9BACL
MTDLKIQKDVVKLNKITHSVRSAQAILQYGVGAMVDFPDQTLMTAAPEYWEAKVTKIHDERLEKALRVDYFGVPGKSQKDWGITYTRFPQWYFCPQCRRFQALKNWLSEYRKNATLTQKERDPHMKRPRCMECKKDLVPTRIVVACENGHIDDFPWVNWVHDRNIGGERSICSNPSLTFETGATASAGLEGLVVKCKNCSAKATLAGAFDRDVMQKMAEKRGPQYGCSGNMPWKGSSEDCAAFPRAMQRGASSIYYPKVVSSLVIPPYSEKINKKITGSHAFERIQNIIADYEEDEREKKIASRIDRWAEEIGREISAQYIVVKNILLRRFSVQSGAESEEINANGVGYRIEEYEALTGKIPIEDLNGNDFVREDTDISKYNIPFVKGVSLIHKIREVRALTGFTRINPPDAFEVGERIPGFISAKEPSTRWYPAYEVRGEGIFIEFNCNDINNWIRNNNNIAKRAEIVNNNYRETYQGKTTSRLITPKFLLLHTIAHLLIRQLSFECGYTAASLRERIYCSGADDNVEMSAILIYTASGDSEGTLGGLVRQGYWDCLPRIFKKALEIGELCSNDPVCISSEGQGRDALNLASCHSCALLPETSCEEFNVFLDRGVVVGTFEDKELGFYYKWLNS